MMGTKVETERATEERISQRLEREEHVISGWETHEKQNETIFMFWETIWPALEKEGWTKVRGSTPVGFVLESTEVFKSFFEALLPLRIC
jgi:hypothetical protein